MFPYARFEFRGVEHVPARGPVLLASNHRSYFDVAALALVASRIGRPVRFLAKQEIFEAPMVGQVARALGGIPVDRGSGSGEPMRAAAASLRAGEAGHRVAPGDHPTRGGLLRPVAERPDGHRRAWRRRPRPRSSPSASSDTERVWPRSAKLPDMTTLLHPPKVRSWSGPKSSLGHTDAVADTEVLMDAIADLLPPEARTGRAPTPEELARTRPSA